MWGIKDPVMARKILGAFVAAAATFSIWVQKVEGATYHVGDGIGWRVPTGGFNFSTWATQHTFVPGDVLVFDFTTGAHTATQVVKDDYENCSLGNNNPISSQVNGPANYTLARGTSYFICTLSNHCSQGQKVAVTVKSSATGSPSSPTGGTPSAPAPPPSSATRSAYVAASTILVFLSGLMAFFC